MTIVRLVISVAAAAALLAGCGGPDPDLGYVRARLDGAQNPLSEMLDDAALARLGELVCRDPDNPSPALVAAGMQSGSPGITTTQAMQVTTLLQDQYCPA